MTTCASTSVGPRQSLTQFYLQPPQPRTNDDTNQYDDSTDACDDGGVADDGANAVADYASRSYEQRRQIALERLRDAEDRGRSGRRRSGRGTIVILGTMLATSIIFVAAQHQQLELQRRRAAWRRQQLVIEVGDEGQKQLGMRSLNASRTRHRSSWLQFLAKIRVGYAYLLTSLDYICLEFAT